MSSEDSRACDDEEFISEGQIVYFRPKLYGYVTWVQGKVIDFCETQRGTTAAIMKPCGPGFGPKNSQNTFFCQDVDHLYTEMVKSADPRAKKNQEYTTRRKKRRKKK
jgi:hypothetical protein